MDHPERDELLPADQPMTLAVGLVVGGGEIEPLGVLPVGDLDLDVEFEADPDDPDLIHVRTNSPVGPLLADLLDDVVRQLRTPPADDTEEAPGAAPH